MVHWNSKYATYENASKRDDGLAVLTVFAEVSHDQIYKHDRLILKTNKEVNH